VDAQPIWCGSAISPSRWSTQGGTFHEAEAAERSIAQILAKADAARDLHSAWINTNCNPKKGRARKSDSELAAEARYLNRLGQQLNVRCRLESANDSIAKW